MRLGIILCAMLVLGGLLAPVAQAEDAQTPSTSSSGTTTTSSSTSVADSGGSPCRPYCLST